MMLGGDESHTLVTTRPPGDRFAQGLRLSRNPGREAVTDAVPDNNKARDVLSEPSRGGAAFSHETLSHPADGDLDGGASSELERDALEAFAERDLAQGASDEGKREEQSSSEALKQAEKDHGGEEDREDTRRMGVEKILYDPWQTSGADLTIKARQFGSDDTHGDEPERDEASCDEEGIGPCASPGDGELGFASQMPCEVGEDFFSCLVVERLTGRIAVRAAIKSVALDSAVALDPEGGERWIKLFSLGEGSGEGAQGSFQTRRSLGLGQVSCRIGEGDAAFDESRELVDALS